MTVIAGMLYIGITFVGVQRTALYRPVSVPLFVVLGVWVAGDAAANHGWAAVMSYAGADGKGAMSMGVGLTIVLTLFVDAGTVTADFNRWAKDSEGLACLHFQRLSLRQPGRHAGRRHHDRGAGDTERQPVWRRQHVRLHERQADRLAVGARLHLPLSAISVRSARIASTMRQPAGRASWAATCGCSLSALGVIGIIVAAGNVWAFFIQWLTLLGILVPPIGAIILVDQYLLRPNSEATAEWRAGSIHRLGGRFGGCVLCQRISRRNTRPRSPRFIVAGVVYGVLQSVTGTAHAIRTVASARFMKAAVARMRPPPYRI